MVRMDVTDDILDIIEETGATLVRIDFHEEQDDIIFVDENNEEVEGYTVTHSMEEACYNLLEDYGFKIIPGELYPSGKILYLLCLKRGSEQERHHDELMGFNLVNKRKF